MDENLSAETQPTEVQPLPKETEVNPLASPLFSMTIDEAENAYDLGEIDDEQVLDYAHVKEMTDSPEGILYMDIDKVERMYDRGLVSDKQVARWGEFQTLRKELNGDRAGVDYVLAQLMSGSDYEQAVKEAYGDALVQPSALLDPVNLVSDIATGGGMTLLKMGGKGLARNVGREVGYGLAVNAGMSAFEQVFPESVTAQLMGGVLGIAVSRGLLMGGAKTIGPFLKQLKEVDPKRAEALSEVMKAEQVQGDAMADYIVRELQQQADEVFERPIVPKNLQTEEGLREVAEKMQAVVKQTADGGAEFAPKFEFDDVMMKKIAETDNAGAHFVKAIMDSLPKNTIERAKGWSGKGAKPLHSPHRTMEQVSEAGKRHMTQLMKNVGTKREGATRFLKEAREVSANAYDMERRIVAMNQGLMDYEKQVRQMIQDSMGKSFEEEMEALHHLAVLSEIQTHVIGARASSGRTLNIFKKYGNGKFDLSQATEAELGSMAKDHRKQVQDILGSYLNKPNGKGHLSERLKQARTLADTKMHRLMLGTLEFTQASLLTHPASQIVNFMGTGLALANENLVRTVAVGTEALMKRDARILGDVTSMYKGQFAGFARAWQTNGALVDLAKGHPVKAFQKVRSPEAGRAWRALWTGEAQLDAFVRMEGQGTGIIPNIPMPGGWKLPVGTLIRAPFHALTTVDETFKNAAYFGELYSIAAREGRKTGASFDSFFEKGLARNTEHHVEALTKARDVTFSNDLGKMAGGLDKALRNAPGTALKIAFMPFYKVMVNLTKYSAKQTPLGLLTKSQQDIMFSKGKGREKMELISRYALSTAMMWKAGEMYDQGQIVGRIPVDQLELMRTAGIQPYSINTGEGKNVGFNKLDPAATLIGVAADLYQAYDIYEQYMAQSGLTPEQMPIDETELSDVALALMTAFTNPLLEKTMLSSIKDATRVFSEPERMDWEKWTAKQGEKFIPYSKGIDWAQTLANADNGELREVNSMLDLIYKKLDPSKLPTYHDLFGDVVKREPRALGVLNARSRNKSKVVNEMIKVGAFQKRMPKSITFAGVPVELDDKQYVELQGYLKNQNLEKELLTLIEDPAWAENHSDDNKAGQISTMFSNMRKAAVAEYIEAHEAELEELVTLHWDKVETAVNGGKAQRDRKAALIKFIHEEK